MGDLRGLAACNIASIREGVSLGNEARLARVQRNERLARAAEDERPVYEGLILRVLCECGDVDCESTLTIPSGDYFELRAEHRYAIAEDCKSRVSGAATPRAPWRALAPRVRKHQI